MSERGVRTSLPVAALVTMGLLAGLFYAFSVDVVPGANRGGRP
jgi:uncharacterized membrane protein